jgi:hypothetical protein
MWWAPAQVTSPQLGGVLVEGRLCRRVVIEHFDQSIQVLDQIGVRDMLGADVLQQRR